MRGILCVRKPFDLILYSIYLRRKRNNFNISMSKLESGATIRVSIMESHNPKKGKKMDSCINTKLFSSYYVHVVFVFV
jgi:hypothetical protein